MPTSTPSPPLWQHIMNLGDVSQHTFPVCLHNEVMLIECTVLHLSPESPMACSCSAFCLRWQGMPMPYVWAGVCVHYQCLRYLIPPLLNSHIHLSPPINNSIAVHIKCNLAQQLDCRDCPALGPSQHCCVFSIINKPQSTYNMWQSALMQTPITVDWSS